MAFMVYEHTPGAERETTIDFDAQTARVDIAPGQWATVPFLEKAEVQADGSFAFKIEQGGLIRNYAGKVEESGNVEGNQKPQTHLCGVAMIQTDTKIAEIPLTDLQNHGIVAPS